MSKLKIDGNELVNEQYPKNNVEIFAYGYLKPHKNNCNDKVLDIFFRDISAIDPQTYRREINVHELNLMSLSRIIRNQTLTDDFTAKNTILTTFDRSDIKVKPGWQISALNTYQKLFSQTSHYKSFQNQNFSIIFDRKIKKNILFPHSVILSTYYLLSKHITNIIFSSGLESLYYPESLIYDHLSNQWNITLKDGAQKELVPQLFRFISEEYANNQWTELKKKIAASSIQLKHFFDRKKFLYSGESILESNFPSTGIIDLEISYKDIDKDNIMCQRIIKEKSEYQNKNLIVSYLADIPNPNNVKNRTMQRESQPQSKSSDVTSMTDDLPNSKNEETETYFSPTVFSTTKLGIQEVNTRFITIEKEAKSNKITYHTNLSNQIDKVSTNSPLNSGKDNVAPTEIMIDELDNIIIHKNRKSNRLNEFIQMIDACNNQLNSVIFLTNEHLMPKKSVRSKSKKISLTYYNNSNYIRKYATAIGRFENRFITIIEIERDELSLISASTLILISNSDLITEQHEINKLMQKTVDSGIVWPKVRTALLGGAKDKSIELSINKLTHPKKSIEIDISEWARRALVRIF